MQAKQYFNHNPPITIVNFINKAIYITFVQIYLFTKENYFIFVKIYDYAR